MHPKTRFNLLFILKILCVSVSLACLYGIFAGGGWHTNDYGEKWYQEPPTHLAAFYATLRWSVMLLGGVMGALALRRHKTKTAVASIIIATLFNPLLPVHTSQDMWKLLDGAAFAIFFTGPYTVMPETALE